VTVCSVFGVGWARKSSYCETNVVSRQKRSVDSQDSSIYKYILCSNPFVMLSVNFRSCFFKRLSVSIYLASSSIIDTIPVDC